MTGPKKNLTRQEDYRDYDQRNIRDGWPYADADGDRDAKANEPYGRADSNLEQRDDKGFEVSDDAEIASQGGPAVSSKPTEKAIADDGLEEAISLLIENHDARMAATVTVTVHSGVAELSGSVETEAAREKLRNLVLNLQGISDVRDRLRLSGVV